MHKGKVPVFRSEEQMRAGLRILGAEPWSGGFAFLNRQRRNSAERTRRDCNFLADDCLGKAAEELAQKICLYVEQKSATRLYQRR